MPIWYTSVKNAMYDYVKYIETKGIFTDRGLLEFQNNMKDFFWKIESGNNQTRWWETLYKIYSGTESNHWFLMSKIMPKFDQIMSDEAFAREILNVNFE